MIKFRGKKYRLNFRGQMVFGGLITVITIIAIYAEACVFASL